MLETSAQAKAESCCWMPIPDNPSGSQCQTLMSQKPMPKANARSQCLKPMPKANARSQCQKPMPEANAKGNSKSYCQKPMSKANTRSQYQKPMPKANDRIKGYEEDLCLFVVSHSLLKE